MRCPQCGLDTPAGATFCSRCGARLIAPKPAAIREYALDRVFTSWWRFTGAFVIALVLVGFAVRNLYPPRPWQVGAGLLAGALLLLVRAALKRWSTSWSLTSERLIERRGFLSTRRRELELADIRSVEVDRHFLQKLFSLGDVVVASAASTDFMIRMEAISEPEAVAETIRQARLKRLA
ncbi:MAG TPA: PH domain-containing protein [Candidatus Binataceae bacterium]|nr:PH domain-containing protein [Candidatus Binataceae bacterium]